MDMRECAKSDCPYRFPGLSASGKRRGLCSMPKTMLRIGCPEPAGGYKAQ
ncbi:hypothetical protein [Methanocella paludicola]|nr:hypothetical protein [Methanocella paludicola]